MKNHKGNIEILLLLCCIVGVVAFFCFGLGIASMMDEDGSPEATMEELHSLEEIRAEKQRLAEDLKSRKDALDKEMEQESGALANERQWSEAERMAKEKELDQLRDARDRLNRKIDSLRRELAALGRPADPKSRQEKEAELERLAQRLKDIQAKINEKTALLAAMEKEAGRETPAEREKSLQEEIDSVRQRKEALAKQVDELKARSLWGGASKFKNPLYVECRKDGYRLYPGARVLGVAEMGQGKRFETMAASHDVVVLLVRPEGFESFHKAYESVGALSLPRSYEPVDASVELDFLGGGK